MKKGKQGNGDRGEQWGLGTVLCGKTRETSLEKVTLEQSPERGKE